MTLKVVCYGVRPNEVPFFEKLNKYNFELKLVEELLTHDNIDTAGGMDAVILRGNCVADRQNIEKMSEYGIKYVFTRTVGFNHIDLQAAADYNMSVARVPGYSPNAIAELSLTLAMSLLRHVSHTVNKTSKYDFRVDGAMFSKEIRNCKVGIIGTGKIGLTEAMLFKGLGAEVLGYDVFQSDAAKEVVKFVEMDELLAECDIVSLHVPYFPGKNDKMVNAEFIAKMKDGAILINTARGELQDNVAILEAIKSGKLDGFGTDVFANEAAFFFKNFEDGDEISDQTVRELVDLYPKVLVTPHVGSNTDEALSNMIEISFDNLNDVLMTGSTTNAIELPKVK
ncbi:2-hydroxyacid dehydrogenase [Gemella cuniculi]|uniref:2-hydroxyacid dehydrogenase n=1 Tax=Gemella cuniculi TaxID=150240 RepID=UPI000423B1CD|nr:2-hydroxyacid dehydrogenase [Gemella cuniculi]